MTLEEQQRLAAEHEQLTKEYVDALRRQDEAYVAYAGAQCRLNDLRRKVLRNGGRFIAVKDKELPTWAEQTVGDDEIPF